LVVVVEEILVEVDVVVVRMTGGVEVAEVVVTENCAPVDRMKLP
jgi:hypothetical protein